MTFKCSRLSIPEVYEFIYIGNQHHVVNQTCVKLWRLVPRLMEKRSRDDARYAEYVKQHLGNSLSRAIAEIVQYRPTDPIEYLACWLYKFKGMNPAQGRNAGPRSPPIVSVGHSAAGASTSQQHQNLAIGRTAPKPNRNVGTRTPAKPFRCHEISDQITHRTNDEEDFIDEDFSNITTYNAAMAHVHVDFNKIQTDLFDNDDIS